MSPENLRLFLLFLTSIFCILFLSIVAIFTFFDNVLETTSHTILFMIASIKIQNINVPIDLYGYCLQVAILKGLLYNIETNDFYYIVIYPTELHAAVIINQTLYTTSNIDSPIKFIYKCKINEKFRAILLTNDSPLINYVLNDFLAKGLKFVECERTNYKTYTSVSLISKATIE